jgi:adenine-specific DNA-methyltransferase
MRIHVNTLYPYDVFGHGASEVRARRVPQRDLMASTNQLIAGDNLTALHHLRGSCEGAVRLVYLDPPYNTGSDKDHYGDRSAPEAWVEMMRARLVAILPLLADNGVVVAQVDKHEQASLKVLMDEVFGRAHFVTTVAVRMSGTSGFKIEHTDKTIVKNTEFIHIYARRLELEAKVHMSADYDSHYALFMEPGEGGRWRFFRLVEHPAVAARLTASGLKHTAMALVLLYRDDALFREFVAAHGAHVCRTHTAPAASRREHEAGTLFADGLPADAVALRRHGGQDYWLRRTRSGIDQLIPIGLKLHPVDRPGGADEVVLTNIAGDWWDDFHLDMGNVELEGDVASFKAGKKPERLIRRILRTFTLPGDLVLDPFAGSGTTPAVAHKMGRRWIALEAGAQWRSHILPRLRRVVAGKDPSGVTEAEGWQGGGDFSVVELGPAT